MKMCVSKKTWNWSVLAKRRRILQMCVIWKEVLFEKAHYSKKCVIQKDVLLKRCVIQKVRYSAKGVLS